jgi:hypothetical protein
MSISKHEVVSLVSSQLLSAIYLRAFQDSTPETFQQKVAEAREQVMSDFVEMKKTVSAALYNRNG